MEPTKYDRYKKVTDEFHAIYEAFRESGFTKDEAFELMKCYCRSDSFLLMLKQFDRDKYSYDRSGLHRYMKNKKVEDENNG